MPKGNAVGQYLREKYGDDWTVESVQQSPKNQPKQTQPQPQPQGNSQDYFAEEKQRLDEQWQPQWRSVEDEDIFGSAPGAASAGAAAQTPFDMAVDLAERANAAQRPQRAESAQPQTAPEAETQRKEPQAAEAPTEREDEGPSWKDKIAQYMDTAKEQGKAHRQARTGELARQTMEALDAMSPRRAETGQTLPEARRQQNLQDAYRGSYLYEAQTKSAEQLQQELADARERARATREIVEAAKEGRMPAEDLARVQARMPEHEALLRQYENEASKAERALAQRQGMDYYEQLQPFVRYAQNATDFERTSKIVPKPMQDALDLIAGNRERDEALAHYQVAKAYAEKYGKDGQLTEEADAMLKLAWRYSLLTDDEKAIYNALAEDDRKSGVNNRAGAFLDTLNLDERQQIADAERRYGRSGDSFWRQIGNAAYKIGDELAEGTNRAMAGTDSFFSGRTDPWLEQRIRSDMENPDYSSMLHNNSILWRSMSGAARSIGQMIPSMIAGNMAGAAAAPFSGALSAGTQGILDAAKVGKYAANAAFYAEIKGNTVPEAKIRYGMDDKQADLYGTLVAATEVGLQSLIGGISQFGGISEKIGSRIAGIDNALLRAAASFGSNYGGELIEEETQNFLEPFYRMIVTGSDYEAPRAQELLETALSTFMMISATGGGEALEEYKNGRARQNMLDMAQKAEGLGLEQTAQTLNEIVQEADATEGGRITKDDLMTAAAMMQYEEAEQAQARIDAREAGQAAETGGPSPVPGTTAPTEQEAVEDADEALDLASLEATAPPEQAQYLDQEITGPENVPTVSLQDFRDTVKQIYPPGNGVKRQAQQIIDDLASEVVRSGVISEDAIDRAAEQLEALAAYETEDEGDLLAREFRQDYRGQRIYVDESTKADLGDDWNVLRKAAAGAGIILQTKPYYKVGKGENQVTAQAQSADGVFGDILQDANFSSLFSGVDYNQTAEFLRRFIDVMRQGVNRPVSYNEHIIGYGREMDQVHAGIRQQLTDAASQLLRDSAREQRWAERYGDRRRGRGRAVGGAMALETGGTLTNEAGQAVKGGNEFSTAADALTKAGDQYGYMEQRETMAPDRSVEIPNRMDSETKVSGVARTMAETAAVPREFVSRVLENEVAAGTFSIVPEGNAKQAEAGRAWLDQRVEENTLKNDGSKPLLSTAQDWKTATATDGRTTDADGKTVRLKNTEMQAAGFSLLSRLANEAQNQNYSEEVRQQYDRAALDVLVSLQKTVTDAARLLQMQQLLQKMSPEYQVYSVDAAVEQLNEQLKSRGIEIQAKEGLKKDLLDVLNSGDQTRIDDAREALYRDIAAQTPTNWIDKLNAWRYLCMLGNPKTVIRNFLGNVGFVPMKTISGELQAGVQAALQKAGVIDQTERTKYGGVLFATERGRAVTRWARGDYQNVKEEVKGEGKYGQNASSPAKALQQVIHEYNSEFKNPILRGAQKASEFTLNSEFMGDALFLRENYVNEMGQIAMARGYSVDANGQLVTKTGQLVSEQQLETMRDAAIRQAQKATYRDASALAEVLKKARSKGNTPFGKAWNLWMDANVPFRGTPANIVTRMVEYSPIGLMKTVALDTAKLAKGEISAVDYVENLCDGLTGSGIVALGAYLAAQGILSGGNVDDDDKREGKQKYSLNIGGRSIPIDWLAPEAAIMLSGATLWESLQKAGEKNPWDIITDAAGKYLEPMVETSMLSGIQNMIDSMGYTDNKIGNLLYANTVGSFMNYMGQYVPTLNGQFWALFRPEKMSTYTGDITSNTGKQFTRSAANLGKKLGLDVIGNAIGRKTGNENAGSDFLRQQPTLDDWGRTQSTGTLGERAFNQFLNPANVSRIYETDTDREISRLNEQTEDNLSPDRRGYEITIRKQGEDGEVTSEKVRLNAEQWQNYQQTYGQTYKEYADALKNSEMYKGMTDAEKGKAMAAAEKLANEAGKAAAGVGYQPDAGQNKNLWNMLQDGLSFPDAWRVKEWDRSAGADQAGEMWAYKMGLNQAENGSGQAGLVPTEITEALERVYTAAGDGKLPTGDIPDSFKIDGEEIELTDEQKEQFKSERATVYNGIVSDLLASSRFQNADAEKQLAMMNEAYEAAGEAAKANLGLGYEPDRKSYKLIQSGLGVAEAVDAKQEHDRIDEMKKPDGKKLDANTKAANFKAWVEKQGWDRSQKEAVLDAYGKYPTMMMSDTERYDKLTSYGIGSDKASKMITDLARLLPQDGKEDVTELQRLELIGKQSGLTDEQKQKMAFLYAGNSKTTLDKFFDSGLGVSDFVEVKNAIQKYGHQTESGNWSWAKDELVDYLNNHTDYTGAQKYWIFKTLKSTTKDKNNPWIGYKGDAAEHAHPETKDEEPQSAPAASSSDDPRVAAARRKEAMGQTLTAEEWTLLYGG